MKNSYDVIIVGAGAGGLMCAAHLPQNSRILLIDSNEKIARKIKISGGGKCNITNKYLSVQNYTPYSTLLEETLRRFDNKKMLAWLRQNGVALQCKEGRFYFCQKSSEQIIALLQRLTAHTRFMPKTTLQSISRTQEGFCLHTTQGEFFAKRVVMASGGASYKSIGASDIALQIAKKFDISYTPFRPALVGLTLQKEQFWMKSLSGITLDVAIRLPKKVIYGALLFAHRGISGPSVLNASLYWNRGEISIDFLPNSQLTTLLKSAPKKQISSVLPLPKRFVKAFLEHLGIADKACAKLTPDEINRVQTLHNYSFAPAGNFGFSKAEVSRGGVCCDELGEDFQARKIPGLYFVAEAVDVTGELGGYNFQWAFASGYLCAQALKKSLSKPM